ncbi:MAG: peptidoglycan binding domain-containing protein [Deltaproteobacteria bacterium]
MPRTGKSIARIVSLVTASICVCLLFVSLALARRDAIIYPSNVWVGGVAIGNLTPEGAAKALALHYREADDINLKLPDKTLRIPLKDLGIKHDNGATINKVNKSLFSDGGMSGLLHHSIIRGKRQEIAGAFIWDAGILKRQMQVIKTENDKPATDARILYYNNYWEYVSHSNGYTVDQGKSYNIVTQALRRGTVAGLVLAVNESRPRVKLDDITRIDGIIGHSETDLPGSFSQYVSTLKYVNGLIILPGDRIDLAMTGNGYSGLIIGALSSACFQAGMQSKGRYIYNSLGHPILVSSITEADSLTIRIYKCRGGSNS